MADCVRRAWLTLGGQSVDLEDYDGGWFCSELDLGYPEVRDVVSNQPDRSGVIDRTAYMGARVISATVEAIAGAGAQIDAVAASFAPFMVPAARPVLHYVLDRPGAAERTFTVRASGYAWPIAGAYQREISLQWVAADPVARDPLQRSVTAWSGSSTVAGRTYNLTFARVYPPGGGGATSASIASDGDVGVQPLYRIYGPITDPVISLTLYADNTTVTGTAQIRFMSGLVISAGHWLDVDSAARTALRDSDPNQSALANVDWLNTTWPVIAPVPGWARMTLQGSSTSGVTQVQAMWLDGYLT